MWGQVAELTAETDKARGFRIDVETDSTVEMDAGQTQGARTEFLQSAGNFLNNALPVMQAAPDLVPVMGEMLLFTVRGYRAGRTLETAFEEAVLHHHVAPGAGAASPGTGGAGATSPRDRPRGPGAGGTYRAADPD